MPNLYVACKQLVDKKFKEIVGPVAKENGFKFKNYFYYRVKNGMLQSFGLKNCCVGWFEVSFFVSPTSLGLTDTGGGNGISYFNKDDKYHIDSVGSWEYYHEPEKIITYMDEVKEIVTERLIPFFDGLTDYKALLNFYKEPMVHSNFNANVNLYLMLEEYEEAEKMLRNNIEKTITRLYDDIYGCSPNKGRHYVLIFKILTDKALILQNLEEKNYDFIKKMIDENERITEEFLKNPKFYRL